jgi:hypothetical protein
MTTEKFTVCWQVEDGYVTGSRPQKFYITADDVEGMSLSEAEAMVDELLQEQFQERVSAAIQNFDLLREWLVRATTKETE